MTRARLSDPCASSRRSAAAVRQHLARRVHDSVPARIELGLEPGAQFVVMGEGDVVILKKIEAPDRREFLALARKVRSQARKAGVKRSDIKKAVRASRRCG